MLSKNMVLSTTSARSYENASLKVCAGVSSPHRFGRNTRPMAKVALTMLGLAAEATPQTARSLEEHAVRRHRTAPNQAGALMGHTVHRKQGVPIQADAQTLQGVPNQAGAQTLQAVPNQVGVNPVTLPHMAILPTSAQLPPPRGQSRAARNPQNGAAA